MHKIIAQKEIMNFFSDNEILRGVHQGMRAETEIKVSTLLGLIVHSSDYTRPSVISPDSNDLYSGVGSYFLECLLAPYIAMPEQSSSAR